MQAALKLSEIKECEMARQILCSLYGEKTGLETWDNLLSLMNSYGGKISQQSFTPSEKDCMLITYADSILRDQEIPLQTLRSFLKEELGSLTNAVHILPFYPWSSDYGFSVKDYETVNPEWGTWEDVHALSRDFDLMFDAVINHMSAQSNWFQCYLKGDPEFQDFFVEADPSLDYSKVVRPRALPLLTKYDTANGEKWIWTTFSADQIDLNYQSPKLLLTIIKILLDYAAHGATYVRLDAIGFLWKELGTNCMHLPQTHDVIRLMRIVLNEVAPRVQMITETNVPHDENISYFGNGQDEAQCVYNFSLPPLTAHAILRENAETLTNWAASLSLPSDQVTFFNFLASHDGIGMRPLQGILPQEEIQFLCETTLSRKGEISYKDNGDGTHSPYELNCTYMDLLNPLDENDLARAKRHLLAHAIALSMPGIPGIYIHSVLGSRNYVRGIEETGSKRAINRENLDYDKTASELQTEGTLRNIVFQGMQKLIGTRTAENSFSPRASFKVLSLDKKLFVIERRHPDNDYSVCAVHNVSSNPITVTLPNEASAELLSGTSVSGRNQTIPAFSAAWFKC